MRARLLFVLVVGAVGCGPQPLTPGPGSGGAVGTGGATGTGGALGTGGCGTNESKIACFGACYQQAVASVCVNGTWTCPPVSGACPLPDCSGTIASGCTCNPSSGLVSCGYDAGPGDAAVGDAGAGCLAAGQDGGLEACVGTCGSDVGVGCACNPLNGMVSCPPVG